MILLAQRLRTFGVDGVPGVVEEERVAVDVRLRQLDCELCRVGEDVSRRRCRRPYRRLAGYEP